MNIHLRHAMLCLTLMQPSLCLTQQALFIDTAGKTHHDYRNLLALAQSTGFKATYQNFYSFISATKIQNCETIFFMIDSEVIRNSNNVLAQKCLKSIEAQVTLGNKNIALLLPPTFSAEHAALFLKALGITVQPEMQTMLETFVRSTFIHDVHKGKLFGTTLINVAPTDKFEHEHYTSLTNPTTGELLAVTLPHQNNTIDPTIAKTFPLALCFYDKQLKNTYLIANTSDFTFCEIAENFFANPISFDLRQQRLKAIQLVLQDFYAIATTHNLVSPQQQNKLVLPKKLTKRFNIEQKKQYEEKLTTRLAKSSDYAWILEQQLLCGWLDPDDYFIEEPKETTPSAIQRGMDFIYTSEINLAWFEFNPELALSSVIQKEPQPFFDKVTTLSTEMKKRCADGKKQLPKFFVGTDITTNFRTHPVAAAVKDFYGNVYSKIPSPLDFAGFWKPELLDVFDKLVEKLGDKITIDGIFFDFEMYHAQDQASGYTDHMDFSDFAWKLYANRTKNQQLLTHVSVLSRTMYLANNNLFAHYFETLTAEARSIGQKIKQHIKSKLPHALIAAYATTLPATWFYRGIMAGLSSSQEPLILATFNTDFYSHAAWLEQQGIFLIHGTAIMLSKFEKESDVQLIPQLMTYQHFVWLNRPSRMIWPPEKRKNIWWESEASPLPASTIAHEIQKQIFTNSVNKK